MGFWNFIGLANKRDIDNINKQLEDMKNLIGVTIEASDKLDATSTKIKEQVSEGSISVKEYIKSLGEEVNEKLLDYNTESVKNQEVLSKMLEKINTQISKLNKKSETHLSSLEDALKGISELNTAASGISAAVNDHEALNQLIKDVKDNRKEIDALTKDVSIVQQMIRVVWVNDIIDTVESKVPVTKK